MNASTLVQKLWNYCNVLRDDGMSYGDYVEQLTYLLFLKMADERSKPPYSQKSLIPADYAWPTLLAKSGDELFDHYRHALEELGKQKGTLGLIFGLARGFVFVAIAYLFYGWLLPFDKQEPWVRTAFSLPMIKSTGEALLAFMPPEIADRAEAGDVGD